MRHQSSWHSIVQPASSRARVPRLFFFSREGVFTGQDFSTQVEEHHLIHGLVPGLPLGAAVFFKKVKVLFVWANQKAYISCTKTDGKNVESIVQTMPMQ